MSDNKDKGKKVKFEGPQFKLKLKIKVKPGDRPKVKSKTDKPEK